MVYGLLRGLYPWLSCIVGLYRFEQGRSDPQRSTSFVDIQISQCLDQIRLDQLRSDAHGELDAGMHSLKMGSWRFVENVRSRPVLVLTKRGANWNSNIYKRRELQSEFLDESPCQGSNLAEGADLPSAPYCYFRRMGCGK